MIFERVADARYRLTDAEHGVILDISRLRRQYDSLVGELAVSCGGLLGTRNVDGVISVANFNLSDARARRERSQTLATNAKTNKIDWLVLLETFCQRVLAADREGQPAIVLSELPEPTPDEEINILGLCVPARHAAIAFGDGGTLKSYVMLFVLGQLARGGLQTVLYDWELDESTHRRRLSQLFDAPLPRVRYMRCDRPLVYEIDRLDRQRRLDAVDYAGFDSCGFATEGAPESAEAALGYFRAVRQLGIGSLHIAHTTKLGDQSEHRPFGSAFWHNSARSTWFVKRAGDPAPGHGISLGLFHRKANLGPLHPPQALEASFTDKRVTFATVDVATVAELADSLPLWSRIRGELRTGPQTIAAVAESLGVKPDSVEKAIKRKSDVFTRVPGSDGIRRIALVERRAS